MKEKVNELIIAIIDSTIEQTKENQNIKSYEIDDKDLKVKSVYNTLSENVRAIKDLIMISELIK